MKTRHPVGLKTPNAILGPPVQSTADTVHRMPYSTKSVWLHSGMGLIIASLLLVVIAISFMAAVPPVSRDALTHHLAVPKLWIQQGNIHPIPSIPFSYFPMNLDLLYVLPMLMGNDIVPKYIHFAFGLGTAILIYAYLRKRTNQYCGLLGALLFLSTPVIVKLCINVYVDLGLIFFTWASMYCLFEWGRSSFKKNHLVVAAVFCGLAMGTKYNGLLVYCLLTLCVPLVHIRMKRAHQTAVAARSLISTVVFAAAALAVFSPWMIRNYRLTGNPVYPLYNQVFTDASEVEGSQAASMKPWLQRKLIYQETAMETALIPIRVFFQGQDDDPRYFDGRLNPILFIFPFFAFIGFKMRDRNARWELTIMAAFAVLYLLYASFLVDMRVRYIAPIIPPLVVLTVIGIKNGLAVLEKRAAALKTGLIVVVAILLGMNALYIYGLFTIVAPIPYLSGRVSRSAYIERYRPEYPVVETANHLAGDRVRILALFLGNRRYYFDKDVEFATETFKNIVERSISAKDLATDLIARGFTHVIVGVSLYKNWARNNFSNEQLSIINQFFSEYGHSVESKNGYALFAISFPINP